MLSADDLFTIKYERLRSIFQHTPVTASVTIINASITAGFSTPIEETGFSTLWLTAIFIVSIVRLVGARIFLRRGQVNSLYARMMFSVLSTLVNGTLWGIAATWLSPFEGSRQLFLTMTICGMCAGAVTVNAAHLPTLLAFVLPSSLSLVWVLWGMGPAWQAATVMVGVFALSMSLIGLRAHRAFGDSIRLRLALNQEQRKLSNANEQLHLEMDQRRTAEATLHQAQKMEAIGHLTGGIAHDFNNLLQVIIGNLNLIRRLSGTNMRLANYALAAEKAAARGAELTSSLLLFARRHALEAERVDLNALLTEFEPILLRTLGKSIECQIILAPDLPPCQADPAHFQSAVLNLVINARDAMPNGGRLLISTGHAMLDPAALVQNPDASPGHFVNVSVQDSGFGMTAEVMARVFEPFFTTKEIGKGSGLGLSQIYGFARQSGGLIQLISQPDEGTTAVLWLPVAKDNATSART